MHAVAIIISISCLAFSAIAVVVKDDNAIVQLVFDNYYRSLNASGIYARAIMQIFHAFYSYKV